MTPKRGKGRIIVDVNGNETEEQAIQRTMEEAPPPDFDKMTAAELAEATFAPANEPIIQTYRAPEVGAGAKLPEKLPLFDKETSGLRMAYISALRPCPTNPRRSLGDIDELSQSISRVGVLQPLLVRPAHDKDGAPFFEIVFGHRRFAAAQKAGLTHVPVDIRVLSDVEALEAQLIENCQRTDIHPMEEAEGYERLHKDHGYSVDDIAIKVGKSRAFVYARMKLCDLCQEARGMFFAGRLNPSTALLIARIPHVKLQQKASQEIAGEAREPLSTRAAAEHLRNNYMLVLKDAPFDKKDDMLVPAAGACAKCPKRSGNNPDLFGDIDRQDICTDPVCFKSKVDAYWENVSTKARNDGHLTLSMNEGRKIYRYANALTWDSKYLEVDAVCPDDKEKRTWRKMLGDNLPQLYIVPDAEGRPHSLVLKDAAIEALKKTSSKIAARMAEEREKQKPPKAEDKEADEKSRALRERVCDEIIGEAVHHVASAGLEAPELRMMCFALEHMVGVDHMLKRRELSGEKAFDKLVEKSNAKELQAIIFELAISEWVGPGWDDYTDELKALAKMRKINLKNVEEAARKVIDAESLFDKKKKKEKKEEADA